MLFPVSGVETNPVAPFLVALVVSSFTSMGGVSGAFLLLPFQMSVLGFTSAAVSPTNLVFNVVAIPSGVYRNLREGRMNWPLPFLNFLERLLFQRNVCYHASHETIWRRKSKLIRVEFAEKAPPKAFLDCGSLSCRGNIL
jgi:hypothetical protein